MVVLGKHEGIVAYHRAGSGKPGEGRMFTIIAFFSIAAIAWFAGRANIKDRAAVTLLSDDEAKTAVLHTRQDVKLIAFLLAAILVMLGIVADRLP
jgi:hypothetical protein